VRPVNRAWRKSTNQRDHPKEDPYGNHKSRPHLVKPAAAGS
jgi:hypothetical protein